MRERCQIRARTPTRFVSGTVVVLAGAGAASRHVLHLTMSTASTSPGFPWNWWSTLLAAPTNFVQPILPNWTIGPVLTINNDNSTAPQTESEVVQRHSYGRQLGRMSDVLEALITERGSETEKREPFTSFLEMKHEIDKVKLDAAVSRVEQLRRDLASLRAERSPEYERLREAVRRVIED
jgi:hypothetical protein